MASDRNPSKGVRVKVHNRNPKLRANSGKIKIINGKTYELHPTKGWKKKGEHK